MSKPYLPRPYQNIITDAIVNTNRVNVFASMGLGKSVSTLTAIERLILSGQQTQPVLILAPLRVAKSTWPDEVNKWDHLSHLEMEPIVGPSAKRLEALRNPNASVFTTNYENIQWLIEQYAGKAWPFNMIVADESTKLKGFRSRQGTARAKALATVAHKQVNRWVNLTGTPAPNGLKDLWGQQWFIDGGTRLGRSYTSFKERWFNTGYNGFEMNALPTAEGEINKALKDCSLSLDAKDWFDIKEPIKNIIGVELPEKAMRQYQTMEKLLFLELSAEIEIEALNAAAKTQKCLQIASGAIYIDDKKNWEEIHDVKIKALEEVIEEANGAPVLVAYHFKHDLARIKKAFPNAKVLDSNTSTIVDWNAGKIDMLLAHASSAGHGLNLQDGGNILVFFSVNWNLEEHQQIIERIGPVRQLQAGHNRPVFVHYILANNTLDYDVMDRLETKKSVQDSLLNAMKRRQ